MTPSTDTLKQEESWEKEFDKFINEACKDRGEEQFISEGYGFNDELREFIRSLIHQTQQAERKRIAELAKKVTSAVQNENFKRYVDAYEYTINIEDFNDATQELLIRLLKKLEDKT